MRETFVQERKRYAHTFVYIHTHTHVQNACIYEGDNYPHGGDPNGPQGLRVPLSPSPADNTHTPSQ
jgi:hypothetical protein